MNLKIGDKAPHFILSGYPDQEINLSNLKGKKVVLYFYPKDNTPGCTQEACDFRDHFLRFQPHNVAIFGVSPDPIGLHQKFIEKYSLPFPLLSDPGGQVALLYGAWGEKSMYGRTYMGVLRSTVLIDEEGIIIALWRNVKVKDHVEEILKILYQ
jgi:peroxiredoxin Q/BCP